LHSDWNSIALAGSYLNSSILRSASDSFLLVCYLTDQTFWKPNHHTHESIKTDNDIHRLLPFCIWFPV
jgi:hypothetical protein